MQNISTGLIQIDPEFPLLRSKKVEKIVIPRVSNILAVSKICLYTLILEAFPLPLPHSFVLYGKRGQI